MGCYLRFVHQVDEVTPWAQNLHQPLVGVALLSGRLEDEAKLPAPLVGAGDGILDPRPRNNPHSHFQNAYSA